jgi:hypothetical protein
MQDPAQIAQLVAARQKEILDEVLPRLIPAPQDPMSDPLVTIRMRELELKQLTEQRKAEMDKAQLMMDTAAQRQKAVTDSARLDLQEQIAEDRTDVNRERIAVQQRAAMIKAQGGV